MRRIFAVLPVLLALAVLLGSCTAPAACMEEATAFRAALCNAGGCSFQAEITADHGDYTTTFTLQCRYDTQSGALDFTVAAPDSISGIAGTVDTDRKTVTFAATALETPLLAAEKLAPVALPQVLGESWAGSYIAQAGSDHAYTVVLYQNGYEDDTLQVETWFSEGAPVYASIWYDGVGQAGVQISDFQLY